MSLHIGSFGRYGSADVEREVNVFGCVKQRTAMRDAKGLEERERERVRESVR